ncbi:hypothetical protein A2U01_0036528, partial [Trifolium medium]|nr:hypothetical protein [Trifolium medium]
VVGMNYGGEEARKGEVSWKGGGLSGMGPHFLFLLVEGSAKKLFTWHGS